MTIAILVPWNEKIGGSQNKLPYWAHVRRIEASGACLMRKGVPVEMGHSSCSVTAKIVAAGKYSLLLMAQDRDNLCFASLYSVACVMLPSHFNFDTKVLG